MAQWPIVPAFGGMFRDNDLGTVPPLLCPKLFRLQKDIQHPGQQSHLPQR